MNKLPTFFDLPHEIVSHFLDYLPPQGLLSLICIIPHLLNFVSPAHFHVVSERRETLLNLLAEDEDSEMQALVLATPLRTRTSSTGWIGLLSGSHYKTYTTLFTAP